MRQEKRGEDETSLVLDTSDGSSITPVELRGETLRDLTIVGLSTTIIRGEKGYVTRGEG